MAKDIEQQNVAEEAGAPLPELRLLDRRAFVGFPSVTVAPGVVISDFALQIPDVSFPFNLSGGALRYQRRTLHFGFLEVSIDAEVISRRVSELAGKIPELDDLKVHFRPGYLEGQARLKSAERTPLTFKLAFDGDAEKLAVYVYDVRLYGFSATPAAQLPVLLSRAARDLELLPDIELRGCTGFTSRVLPVLCQHAAVSRGFKLPLLDQARLSAAEVSAQGLRLRFAAGGLPPPNNPDEELLLALEGSRAFAEAETLVSLGKLAEAREAYLKLGDVQEAHPFAAERLLSLLVADPQAHELVLDIAAAVLRRREKSPAALWCEAIVRERRGELARAAERFLALCALSRKNSEEAAAFFAAEAAARAARDQAPQMAVKALHELLGLRPDHLPSLKALARASDLAKDRAGAIRAFRRIAALARDPIEAAEAHVALARLCAETEDDVAGARLHCEAALRLSPDQPDALYHLGELCHRAGEHLRALKALDRLREVAMARHELDRVGRSNLLAGKVWELGLTQAENALLRYREACALLPGEPEPLYLAARVAERLGKMQEALAGYQQAVELAGPAPASDEVRKAAHQSHHALSRLHRTRLGDPARAREHLEAALALDPRDTAALDELIPYFRASGRAADLADACEKAAAVTADPARRAQYWAEAGELYRGRLGDLEKADRLLGSALDADPLNRTALEGMLALAESRRDGGQLCRCLKALAELAGEPKERARLFRRLAVAARDLTFDLELATHALTQVLKIEPDDLAALGELCGLHRKRADMNGLAAALDQRARVAEAQNDRRLAAAALRELAQVLELRLGRVGEALVALEKATRLSPDQGVLLDLADLSLRCERPEHARRALEDLLAQLPKSAAPEKMADIRARLGRACDMLGDRDAARENFAAAFPLRRLDDELAARLEVLYEEAGQTDRLSELWGARAQALVAAGRQESAAPLFYKSAQALVRRGEHDTALLRLHAALEAAPDGPHAGEILETMADLELQRGSKLEAAKLFARRAALIGDARGAAKLIFKAAGLSSGSGREASLLAQAVDKDATFAPARVRRAELSLETDPRGALVDLEAVLAVPATDPDAPVAADRPSLIRKAATAAARSGQAETARKYLALYTSARTQDLEALRELAALHRQVGAKEPLCELLGELWPRLTGLDQTTTLREHVELSIELGRPTAATDALRGLLERDPENAWAARSLLALLPAPGTGSPAEEAERLQLITVLIGHSHGDARAELLSRRAHLLRNAGKLAEARADLTAAAESASDPRELLRRAAELAREAGDDRGELAAWRAVLERAPELSALAGGRMLALSQARLKAKDFDAAREGFAACTNLSLPPADRCEAWFGLAEAALGQDDRPAAAAALIEAAAQGPAKRRFEALQRSAQLLEEDGELEQAADALERALTLAPRHPRATAGLKRILTALEDWEGLAEVLASEAAQTPRVQAAPVFMALARLYLDRLGLAGPAEAAFRKVTQLDKANVEAREELAELLFDRGEPFEAARVVEEAAPSLPTSAGAELLREGAQRSLESGQDELALRLYRRAHGLEATQGESLYWLARLLYLQGARREALPLLSQLAQQVDFQDNPDRAEEVLLSLADVAEEIGDAALAERTLRALMDRRPFCAAAADRLATLLSARNPRGAIETLWAYAQRLGPSERVTRLLMSLAERARWELADVDLTARLLTRAGELAAEPIAVHVALAELYREAGRTRELAAELEALAELHQQADAIGAAVDVLDEKARLEEESGRVDEALATLETSRGLWERAEDPAMAARIERRRAELYAAAKLDLALADSALERSFDLAPELETARLGAKLARRREDSRAEARWLERSVPLHATAEERAAALLELAGLFDGALASPSLAEDAVRKALDEQPGAAEAEALLAQLLERDGRMAELASFYEDLASRETDAVRRTELLRRAATIYRDQAGKPEAAAAALLAARASAPDDAALTTEAADLLHQAGRTADAAELDAVLLDADPLNEAVFERHARHLRDTDDHQGLADLLLRRAELQPDKEAAASYLAAAQELRLAGADDRALSCEELAFEKSPDSDDAFEALRARAEADPRKLADVLAQRARSVPTSEAVVLLRERAERLSDAGELLLAAEAFDELLAIAGDDVAALSTRAELAAQAGGPQAAQPYDRRLLAAGGDALPVPIQVKARLRLGHASLVSGAFRDAAESFETVVALDPNGERGREALSLLTEVHGMTGNAEGLFRASLRLAKQAGTDEREALLRRAAELFEDPKEAVDALVPLAELRPADPLIVDRAAAGLQALGRFGDLLALLERSAGATGGPRAAELLLRAAQVAETELSDPAKARELKVRAGKADPANASALKALLDEQRRTRDPELLETIERAIAATRDADELATLRLELAELALEQGNQAKARAALAAVIQQGAEVKGYATALDRLEAMLSAANDDAGVGRVLAAKARLVQGAERAALLLSGGRALQRAGDLDRALELTRAAIATHATAEGHRQHAALLLAKENPSEAAEVLIHAAELSEGDARGPLLVEAAGHAERAGELLRATELLQRVAAEHPGLLPAAELSERLARMGQPVQALELGFAPAMEAGDYERALELADRAGSREKAREVLWALVRKGPENELLRLDRLASELREARDAGGLLQLAKLCEENASSVALSFYYEVACGEDFPAPARIAALEASVAMASAEEALVRVLPTLSEGADPALVDACLAQVRTLDGEARARALTRAGEAIPSRKKALLRERLAFERASDELDSAAETLIELDSLEEDAQARIELHLELGQLFLRDLKKPEKAEWWLQLALGQDKGSRTAVLTLLELYQQIDNPKQFVAMAELLAKLEGPEAAAPYRDRQVEAYEKLDRGMDAYRILAQLEETPERLQKRVQLAQALGLAGESLQLRERSTQDPIELEQVLVGYLEVDLLPFAARLYEKLEGRGYRVTEPTRRTLADRLSSSPEGAPLAVRLWKELLTADVTDADSWTLLAEALRKVDRTELATQADGFGAVLAGTEMAAPVAVMSPVARSWTEGLTLPRPLSAVPLTAAAMPRLHGTLSMALEALGAPMMDLFLDAAGGVEAYLTGQDEFVLGAGALACFTSAELGYLCALALSLGPSGQQLARPGPVEGFEAAAAAASVAVPAALAASRVLAQLDDSVRGVDPLTVDVREVLKASLAFRAVALKVLALV